MDGGGVRGVSVCLYKGRRVGEKIKPVKNVWCVLLPAPNQNLFVKNETWAFLSTFCLEFETVEGPFSYNTFLTLLLTAWAQTKGKSWSSSLFQCCMPDADKAGLKIKAGMTIVLQSYILWASYLPTCS